MVDQGTKVTIPDSTREARVKVGVWLPRSLDREIERVAFLLDVPKVRIVEDALRAYLETHPVSAPPGVPAGGQVVEV